VAIKRLLKVVLAKVSLRESLDELAKINVIREVDIVAVAP
jgi:hypothetical protein